jgi:hypothetical protein
MEDVGIFYGHLVYLVFQMAIWYILWTSCSKKNLATLVEMARDSAPWKKREGANPTTFEFTTTTAVLK